MFPIAHSGYGGWLGSSGRIAVTQLQFMQLSGKKVEGQQMSGMGQKPTSCHARVMSESV
jgi:hypothetical protein